MIFSVNRGPRGQGCLPSRPAAQSLLTMPLSSLIPGRLRRWFLESSPHRAYDRCAARDDAQPDNLMLALEEEVFAELLPAAALQGWLADIGCGTGRHWRALMAGGATHIVGCDPSPRMLEMLRSKFPGAETLRVRGEKLTALAGGRFDGLVCTLALAHIRRLDLAFAEWDRILRPGGHILLTDYHPAALARGADRSFRYQGRTVYIRNYLHSLADLKAAARRRRWVFTRLAERVIDLRCRPYYEARQATALYERFEGSPIVYGCLIKKSHDPA